MNNTMEVDYLGGVFVYLIDDNIYYELPLLFLYGILDKLIKIFY